MNRPQDVLALLQAGAEVNSTDEVFMIQKVSRSHE